MLKKEKKDFLVLLLEDKFSKMYVGNAAQLKLIKSNTLLNEQNHQNGITETPAFCDTAAKQNLL